jgi:hypothetical protein
MSASTNDFATEYQQNSDDELLQLWVERSQLFPEARAALGEEIRKRRLGDEAKHATDRRAEPPERELAPRIYFSFVVCFWIRELWLRNRTKEGMPVEAEVISAIQTKKPFRGAARAELRYSYEYEGNHYIGRTVRDFVFGHQAADALAFGHKVGEKITIRIDPTHPNHSYFPSGFGWIEAVFNGGLGLFWLALVLIFFFHKH